MTITDTSIATESRDRFLTYALSVVSGRAIPDVRDGLKPVQRRILYAMYNDLNLKPQGSFRKSASVVGAVLARYHPHGDSACYEAMVRMTQDFSLRYPLVDGQGNFGSIDGDSAAAYRYTEAKLLPLALEVIGEIDQDTVAFRPNFDASAEEPVVFASTFPHLLVNGAAGIAVGMATSIPPHNLRDVVKATITLLEDPEITEGKLAKAIRGPDFPTGCTILNTNKELEEMYKTGRGSIRMRGTWKTEDLSRGKKQIIITSVPFAVNKSQLVEKIADLIIEKKLPQITDVRDESTEDVRVVIELASNAEAEVAMAYIFKHTPLESNFAVNLSALVPTDNGSLRPELLSLKKMLSEFISFREEVITKRLSFEKKKLLERIHILEGLVLIFDALDKVIAIVRKSDGRSDAADKLMNSFKLTEIQAFAVVDMRIYQLSKTNILEIKEELSNKQKRVNEIDKLLKNKKALRGLLQEELEKVAEKFGDKRKCAFDAEASEVVFNAEDYIVNEDVYAIVTRDGWVKRIRQTNEYSTTRIREGDEIFAAVPGSTADFILFFTNLGGQYGVRLNEIPSSSGYGDPIQKICKFRDGERIVAVGLNRASQESERKPFEMRDKDTIVLLSRGGMGFALTLEDLAQTRKSSRKVMNIKDGDEMVSASLLQEKFLMVTQEGSALLINKDEIPVRNSAAVGVILMGVREDDQIIGGISFLKAQEVICVLDNDKEKEVPIKEVTSGHRGLKGTKIVQRAQIKKITVR